MGMEIFSLRKTRRYPDNLLLNGNFGLWRRKRLHEKFRTASCVGSSRSTSHLIAWAFEWEIRFFSRRPRPERAPRGGVDLRRSCYWVNLAPRYPFTDKHSRWLAIAYAGKSAPRQNQGPLVRTPLTILSDLSPPWKRRTSTRILRSAPWIYRRPNPPSPIPLSPDLGRRGLRMT